MRAVGPMQIIDNDTGIQLDVPYIRVSYSLRLVPPRWYSSHHADVGCNLFPSGGLLTGNRSVTLGGLAAHNSNPYHHFRK
jgi:hypothetical protein